MYDHEKALEEKVARYEAALRKISATCQKIYQASLDAELAGSELSASTFAFALGSVLGDAEKALEQR